MHSIFTWQREPTETTTTFATVTHNASLVLEVIELQRDHWRKLHTTRFTPEECELWIQGIPGCSSCQRDFRRILKNHPPRFDDWERWTWEIHNEVNSKLGKQLIAWTDAIELWGWSIKDIQTDGNAEDSS